MTERLATVFERSIARGRQGSVSTDVVLWTFAASPVLLASTGPVEKGQFPSQPLVFDQDGTQFVAVFSHPDQVTTITDTVTPVVVPAFDVLKRVPQGCGIVVNPGSALNFVIPPESVASFTAALVETQMPGAPAAS